MPFDNFYPTYYSVWHGLVEYCRVLQCIAVCCSAVTLVNVCVPDMLEPQHVHSYVTTTDSLICHMTHWYVTWLIHMSHDSLICHMTHSYVTWLIDMSHDSLICHMTHWYVTWLIDMSHDSLICHKTHWMCVYRTCWSRPIRRLRWSSHLLPAPPVHTQPQTMRESEKARERGAEKERQRDSVCVREREGGFRAECKV